MAKEDIIKSISKIKAEIMMGSYHDGWALIWLKNKLTELELLLENN